MGVECWAWKSAQASPGAAAFKIAVDGPRQETVRATSAPAGGALAKGGTASPLKDDRRGRRGGGRSSQTRTIYTLKLNGESLGDWVNEPVTPGSNFSWAPAPMTMIVFAKRPAAARRGRCGRTSAALAGAKTAVLPAWSSDGSASRGSSAWTEVNLMAADVSGK
jgi:hypothetical protein